VSPLSVHFDGSEDSPASIGKWHFLVGFASLIPFIGLIPACASILWGIMKIEKTGGKSLLVLGILGFCGTGVLTGLYYDKIFPSNYTSSLVASKSSPEGSDKIVWLQPSDGLKESQRSRKPILYDFTAHWCGFCKLMDKNVFDIPGDATKIMGQYVPVVVMDARKEEGRNPQEIADLQAKYQIRGFPTLVIQYPDKGESRQLVGYRGEPDVMAFLGAGKP
jgi:thiol:disulfide interchange protein